MRNPSENTNSPLSDELSLSELDAVRGAAVETVKQNPSPPPRMSESHTNEHYPSLMDGTRGSMVEICRNE